MTTQDMVAAAQFDHAALASIFNDSYTGYEFHTHMDGVAIESMARLVDIDVARSVVARDGDRPVAFAMLALRGHRAWIGGMGVSPAARGRGLGTEVMRAAIANARSAGATTVDLEVLVGNAHAYRIYEAPRPMLDALVDGVLSRHPGVPVRLLNLPEGDPAEPVFARLKARAEARQIHMRLTL